jgi:iron complex outermembrane receptor protein
MTIGTFRPYLTGGNPLYDYKHGVGGRYYQKQILLDAGVKGDVTETIKYDVNFSYGQYKTFAEGRDSLTDRLELALRGLGGPSCNITTGTPGVGGCQWLNPFSNAIPGAPNRGLTNPGFVSSLANTAALADWIMPIPDRPDEVPGHGTQRRAVGRGPLAGRWAAEISSGPSAASGGTTATRPSTASSATNCFRRARTRRPRSTATTASSRRTRIRRSPPAPARTSSDRSPSLSISARTSTPGSANSTCRSRTASSSNWPPDMKTTAAKAAPPSIRRCGASGRRRSGWPARFDRHDLPRPPQGSLIPNPTTNLQQVLGTFIPVSTIGNPDLDPEKATVYSVGAIVDVGGFRGSVDYWNYNFKDLLTSEPLTPVVNAVFPNGASGANNCGTPRLPASSPRTSCSPGPAVPGWSRCCCRRSTARASRPRASTST